VLVEARAVGRPGAAAAPGGPGLVVTTAAAGCIAEGVGGGPCVTEVLSLLRLRGAAAGGTAPLPASASVGRWGGGSGGGGAAAAAHLPPRPSPRPAGAAAAATSKPPSARPTTPGPATPDRAPDGAGGGAEAGGNGGEAGELEEFECDDEEAGAASYVHAGEVLWANGHGGAGGALHERWCSGGSAAGSAGVGGAGPSPPPPLPTLPRPPSAAADLHLRGRGESHYHHHAAAASACCGGSGAEAAEGAGPASPPPPLEPCPARRGTVSPATRAAMVHAVRDMLSLAGEDPARPGLRGAADRYVDGLLASTAGYDADVEGVVEAARAAWAARRRGGGGGVATSPPEPARPPSPSLAAPLPPLPPASSALLPPPSVDVAVRFTSMCEHHMLPFHGVARVVCLVDDEGGEGGGGEGGEGGSGGTTTTPTSTLSARALDPATVSALVRAYALRLQVQERLTQQVADAVHAAAGCPPKGTLVVVEAAHMCMVARGVEQHGSATVTVGARGGLAEGGGGRARRELLARLAAG
jgi:GTP cyclohydrolase I